VKLKAKPGEEEPADHLRRRRTSWSQEQARRWRTNRSQARRSRPARSKSASTASNSSCTQHHFCTTTGKGRNFARTSLLVLVYSIYCFWLNPHLGKVMLCSKPSLGNLIKPQFCTSLADHKD
jgi:hypothetical protein